MDKRLRKANESLYCSSDCVLFVHSKREWNAESGKKSKFVLGCHKISFSLEDAVAYEAETKEVIYIDMFDLEGNHDSQLQIKKGKILE